jgi:hypothetical protein
MNAKQIVPAMLIEQAAATIITTNLQREEDDELDLEREFDYWDYYCNMVNRANKDNHMT